MSGDALSGGFAVRQPRPRTPAGIVEYFNRLPSVFDTLLLADGLIELSIERHPDAQREIGEFVEKHGLKILRCQTLPHDSSLTLILEFIG